MVKANWRKKVFSGGHFWNCLGVGRVMGWEGANHEMGEVTNEKELAFVGVDAPIFGPTGDNV